MSGRVLLTSTGSGCGKTTTTVALIKALMMKGIKVASFKCGPDYIDPMYHRNTLGIPSYNLDPFFCDKDNLQQVLALGMAQSDISVIEGVMGYYDGYGKDGKASTCDVSIMTETPAILVVNAKGMSNSVGAILHGFLKYKKHNNIKGVIFNNISKGMYPLLSEIAKDEGVEPLGYLLHNAEVEFSSRHLGLVTDSEALSMQSKIETLSSMALDSLDIEGIIRLANSSKELAFANSDQPKCKNKEINIAVAKDDAFCFIYQENIDILSAMGCNICFFSPIKDEAIPDNCQGLYLPGGYPELYIEELSGNLKMLQSIKAAIEKGMPTIAECGGFMYLHELLEGKKLVGVIKGEAWKKDRLVRFGYGTMQSKADGLLLAKGESIRVHEFHYYDSDNNGDAFEITKDSNGVRYDCAYSTDTMYAGYPHLYFRANINVANRFVAIMKNYRDKQ